MSNQESRARLEGYIKGLEDAKYTAETYEMGSFIVSGLTFDSYISLLAEQIEKYRGQLKEEGEGTL